MAAAVTAFLLLLFLLLQFVQGVLLDLYLETYVKGSVSGTSQLYWLIADGFLLIVTLLYYCILRGERGQSALRHEFLCGVPALAMAWAVYLVVVLLPRTIWVMLIAGRCMGKVEVTNNTSGTASVITGTAGLDLTDLDQNFFVTLVSAGTTGLLVLVTMAQQSEHGLLRRDVALDFDIAEAAFGTIDGVEYWQPFFDANSYQCCCKKLQLTSDQCMSTSNREVYVTGLQPMLNTSIITPTAATVAATTKSNVSTASQSCAEDEMLTQKQLNLINALDGPIGYLLITVASTSFTLPFFAVWQLQKKSIALRQSRSDSAFQAEPDAKTQRSLVALDVVYMLFDLFCINIPGFALRMYLWLSLGQTITALITKNVLGIIFRLLLLWVKYIQPSIKNARAGSNPAADLQQQPARVQGTQAKERWNRPARAAKVADSFKPSDRRSVSGPNVSSGLSPSPRAPRKAFSTTTHPPRHAAHVWHSSSLDSNSPRYPAPAEEEDAISEDVASDCATLVVPVDPIRPSSSVKLRNKSAVTVIDAERASPVQGGTGDDIEASDSQV